jgi:hypothetical protein
LGEADETYSNGVTLMVAVGIAVRRRHIALCRRLQAVGVELWSCSGAMHSIRLGHVLFY